MHNIMQLINMTTLYSSAPRDQQLKVDNMSYKKQPRGAAVKFGLLRPLSFLEVDAADRFVACRLCRRPRVKSRRRGGRLPAAPRARR